MFLGRGESHSAAHGSHPLHLSAEDQRRRVSEGGPAGRHGDQQHFI